MNYNYTRELVDGVYNIDNPRDVDADGEPVRLACRVKEALPNKTFNMKIDGTDVVICFEAELTTEEKNTLDTTVANHKSATGTANCQSCYPIISPDGTFFKIVVENDGTLKAIGG